GDIPLDDWGDISQAEVVTVFGYGWNFAITPILDVDRKLRIITTRRVRRQFERMNRYFIQNVLGALDAPGEWFLDRATDALYFRPPDGQPPGDAVRVPVLDSLIQLRGSLPYPHGYLVVGFKGTRHDFEMPADAPPEQPVEHVVIRGLRLEETRDSGIVLSGARECSVVGCSVSNVGNVGINLGAVASAHEEVGNPRVVPAEGFSGGVAGGGQNILFNDPCVSCRVEGCDVWSVGSDGIFLYGTENVAENNHVFNSGLFDKDCACVNLWGERNVARRNTLHDVPRNAIFIKGTDNVAELNDIHHTMLETCDGGAVRMCQRNLALRGNTIRYNRILDTVGYGYPHTSRSFQSPYYAFGVYLDDFTCGTTIEGNIIARCGRNGVVIHGGSDNTVTGNIIVDPGDVGVALYPIRDDPIAGNQCAHNIITCDGDRCVVYRYSRWVEGALGFADNLVWGRGQPVRVDTGAGGQLFTDWDKWLAFGLDQGSRAEDPQFSDAAADDYRLADDSPARDMGFERIPVAEIGCYQSPARASWPVDPDAGMVREQPVLYTQPVLPVREDFEIDLVGRPPRHGDVMAGPKAAIVVTDEQAAGGAHGLKVLDAPELRQVWLPRIFYPLEYPEGRVRVSLDLRLDGSRPPTLYLDPRQYSDTGDREYFSGPILGVQTDGSLSAGGQKLADLPFDEWVSLAMVLTLGEGAPASTELLVSVPGRELLRVMVPHASPDFQRLERLVIASLTDGVSVFYLDNIVIEKVEAGDAP
ncbi:MAG TPA: right-handed parallel beta-helix repeat-containing protein, partial [Actinomycetes bacterium]|nr:right-handed parallel beta-helix repeat-containing protein [Actinomycetes bacterium]